MKIIKFSPININCITVIYLVFLFNISFLSSKTLYCNLKRKKYPSKNNRKRFHKNETDQQQPNRKTTKKYQPKKFRFELYVSILYIIIIIYTFIFCGCLEVEALQ